MPLPRGAKRGVMCAIGLAREGTGSAQGQPGKTRAAATTGTCDAESLWPKFPGSVQQGIPP
jgi:hypothetical protein